MFSAGAFVLDLEKILETDDKREDLEGDDGGAILRSSWARGVYELEKV